ncbi:hypothetical protein ONE63_007337 [Megalurothrips usitatus]|uniref:C2H2-type domain-containing protein n=1 Tax=Megalurothrips usitatus TaxID=439358 RepID=A0AAV7XUD3_9NEOP|nr:hypothetical protein ONE63_007337 [Megalurothrips usitatus]
MSYGDCLFMITYRISFNSVCFTRWLYAYSCSCCQSLEIWCSMRVQILPSSVSGVNMYPPRYWMPLHTNCFRTYPGLYAHIRSLHPPSDQTIEDRNETSLSLACPVPLCEEKFHGSRALCTHLIGHLTNGESFECPFRDSCESGVNFSVVQQFRSHLSIKHAGWRQDTLDCDLTRNLAPSGAASSSTGCDGGGDVDCNIEDDDGNEFHDAQDFFTEEPSITSEMFVKHLARFYLMLSAECILPERTIQTISEHMATLSELVQYWYREEIVKKLREEGLEEGRIVSILNSILPRDAFYSAHHKDVPGESLTSTHLRQKYFKSNFVNLEPQEISLDNDKEDGEVVYYVSVRKTLEFLLEDPSVKQQVLESFVREDTDEEVYRDYFDGEISKQSSKGKEELALMLFQDGFKAAKNPIGSAANESKFVSTYFVLGNLKPENRTKIDSINLAFLFKESLLRDTDYGLQKCFKPLIDDLKDLTTSGLKFNNRIVPVRVQHISGDSLGAHTIGGFIESFSGNYICRFCEITHDEFHECPFLVKPLRTKDDYNDALEELSAMRVYHKKTENRRGLKRDSPFNEIPGFHVADPRLPPCIAHDLFENGVVSCDLKLMIIYFVKEKWFTFKKLGRMIKNFNYQGQDMNNKPAPVPEAKDKKSKLKLGGHAVQNWYLLRLFPLIIESCLKDPSDKVWQLFLKLKLLVELVCSPVFKSDDLKKLEALTESYMKEREEVLPGAKVKPKYHYLTHYAQMIRLFGPLIYVWTMRFEAKHQFFKRVMRACNNFINIGLTMALRHQKWFSYLTSGVILPNGISDSTRMKPLNIHDKANLVKEIIQRSNFSQHAMEVNRVTCDGTEFRKDSYFVLGKDSAGSIDVGLCKVLAIDKGKVFLVMQKYKARFLSDYGLYQIDDEHSHGIEILSSSLLQYPNAVSVYDFKLNLCFSLKHKV